MRDPTAHRRLIGSPPSPLLAVLHRRLGDRVREGGLETMITNTRTLSLVVLAALAVALSACGGGGGNGPVIDEPMPAAVNLDDVAANAMRPATEEPIVIAAGRSIVHGDVAFSCAAGGPACMVTVADDGTASSTGGMVTATNSEAYVQRMTVADAIDMAETAINALSLTSSDAEVADAESLLVAAKTALADATALSTADRDALNGRIQTVEMTLGEAKARIAQALSELEQAILEISVAIDEAEFRTAALSRTSSDADVIAVEALLANLRTALDAFPPEAVLDPLYWRLQIVEMSLASIKTDIATHRAAVANVIDMAANNNRQDELGEFVGGWWRREPGIGGQQASVTRSYDGGGSVNVILSHDESGQLQHNVAIFQNNSYQLVETTDIRVRMDRAGRYINTYEDPQELEGVTRSTRSISDHGLGAEWQVTELTSEYDGGGTLKIHVATDVNPVDGSVDPFATLTNGYGNIEFSDAPVLPDDQDFLVVRFPYGIIVEGALDGVAGYFDCPAGWCYLSIDRRSRGYYAVSAGLAFTPDGGTAQPVPTLLAGTPPAADYLAFGHWLYVPEDAAEPDDVPPTLGYDFGVFASGGDPFTAGNLRGLTGTATYEGDSAGMYYVGGLSGTPDVGSFTADVELTADFGSNVDTGTIGGQVSNFEFEGDVASSLPETVTLASRTYDYLPEGFGVPQGTTDNIFDTSWRDEVAPYPGGWVGGRTQASVGGQNWYGSWSGAFYGNGTATTDHPTSVAGEFGSYPWGDGNHNQRDTGLTGSFGAHRLATTDPLPDPDPTPDTSWSDSPWVTDFHTSKSVQSSGPLFGSKYGDRISYNLRNYNTIPFGEWEGLLDCVNYFGWCTDQPGNDPNPNTEFALLGNVPFTDNPRLPEIPIIRVRGRMLDSLRIDESQKGRGDREEVGGILGLTEYGYWAVAWTEFSGSSHQRVGSDYKPNFLSPVFGDENNATNFFVQSGIYTNRFRDVHAGDFESLSSIDERWSAVYEGHMSGIAHNFGNAPVGGNVSLNVEFYYDSSPSNVEMILTDIQGLGFELPNIHFPRLGGETVESGDKNSPDGHVSRGYLNFELDYGGQYLSGGLVGPVHDEVHGVFSTEEVSGAFGAIQTGSQNRPPLEQ